MNIETIHFQWHGIIFVDCFSQNNEWHLVWYLPIQLRCSMVSNLFLNESTWPLSSCSVGGVEVVVSWKSRSFCSRSATRLSRVRIKSASIISQEDGCTPTTCGQSFFYLLLEVETVFISYNFLFVSNFCSHNFRQESNLNSLFCQCT